MALYATLCLTAPNLDIDFVVEGNAIQLAHNLQHHHGGEIHSYEPFGTAKWLLNEQVAESLEINAGKIPHHIDFASARNEFYEHPTALPTVYQGSIKLDLQRRDFTINTLAIRLSPVTGSGQILDLFGGMTDLKQGIIRALHSLSFVDDPTRILRALRFEGRLGFEIEERTSELITSAKPMLRRITGERIRNELDLTLQEPQPAEILLRLQDRGLLIAIHPDFSVPADLATRFQTLSTTDISWTHETLDPLTFYWHVIASTIAVDALPDLCERLLFGRKMAQSMLDTAQLMQDFDSLTDPDLRPSEIVEQLNPRAEVALLTAWILSDNSLVNERIQLYLSSWRQIQPVTTGYNLRAMGVEPGPCYSIILNTLRAAWLDGKITSDVEESELLSILIHEECR